MTERKPIKCGPVELVWDEILSGWFRDKDYVWLAVYEGGDCDRYLAKADVSPPFGNYGRITLWSSEWRDTKEQAADDLVKFLGELGAVLAPFVPCRVCKTTENLTTWTICRGCMND